MTSFLPGAAFIAALTITGPVWAQAPMTAEDLNRQELYRLATTTTPPVAGVPVFATAVGASAQAPQWPTVGSYPSNPAPSTPQSWSYDPYTNGSTACPQVNWGNSPPCREILSPTAGQPNYNPTR
jgi:hypothetical protein